MKYVFGLVLPLLLIASQAFGQGEDFSKLVGDVQVQPASTATPVELPWITWGGDVPLFVANGNAVTTASGSRFNKAGLNFKLVSGDDFVGQVKSYLGGRPYIRATMGMLGQASEVLGQDPRTKPVVLAQYTFSLGDHWASVGDVKNLNDLKAFAEKNGRKYKVAAQQGGPHVVLISETLKTATMQPTDIEIVWTPDLSGENGPAALLQAGKVDGACVITPDMLGVTGGLEETGSGAEGTIKGARVINSTSAMSRVITDVLAVRSDYFAANKDSCEKLVSAYLASVRDVVQWRQDYQKSASFKNGTGPKYREALVFAQQTFGKVAIPTLEEDGHGLLLDAHFAGLPGQVAFFEQDGNPNNFEAKQKIVLDLATSWGYASTRKGFAEPGFDFQNVAKLAGIPYTKPTTSGRINPESIDFFPDDANIGGKGIVSFTIGFDPNQQSFSVDTYGTDFDTALANVARFGNAVVAVRGHSDPTRTLTDLIRAGMDKGIITRTGSSAKGYTYFINTTNGKRQLDLTQTQLIQRLIENGSFDGSSVANPRETMQAALNLSKKRADAVVEAIVAYAKTKSIDLDPTQLQPVGAGILEPVVAKPTSLAEAKQNMRVEFRVVPVPAEAVTGDDFDLLK